MLLAKLSLLLNIAVLVPVCGSLLFRSRWVDTAYGPFSPARGILLSIYLAILLGSVVLMFQFNPAYVVTMLSLQVIYKLLSLFLVGTYKNPVIISNLLIAAVHLCSIFTLLPAKAQV